MRCPNGSYYIKTNNKLKISKKNKLNLHFATPSLSLAPGRPYEWPNLGRSLHGYFGIPTSSFWSRIFVLLFLSIFEYLKELIIIVIYSVH